MFAVVVRRVTGYADQQYQPDVTRANSDVTRATHNVTHADDNVRRAAGDVRAPDAKRGQVEPGSPAALATGFAQNYLKL